ncbi:MAG: antitoxin [Phycisphaerales bacterium]|jgi:uncharacterized protein (DUF433 family)|nr:antitoxin [Phycisphaerales bacterium]MDB5357658.1 antitoxin [Phycisphaerales bacterium]
MTWEDRIELKPQVLCGKPVVKGTRISVEHVIKLLADGWSEADLLRSYPHLTSEDVKACLAYAGDVLANERVFPVGTP